MSGWADIALDNRKRTNIIENGVEYREEEFTFPDGTKSWWVNDCFAYGEYQDNISRTRSEERRVGNECRSRWSPYH